MYPGFLQLGGFVSMNFGHHVDQHLALFHNLVEGERGAGPDHRGFLRRVLGRPRPTVCVLSRDHRPGVPTVPSGHGSIRASRSSGRPGGDQADGPSHRGRRARRHLRSGPDHGRPGSLCTHTQGPAATSSAGRGRSLRCVQRQCVGAPDQPRREELHSHQRLTHRADPSGGAPVRPTIVFAQNSASSSSSSSGSATAASIHSIMSGVFMIIST